MNSTLQQILSAPKDFPDARLQAGNLYASLGQWDQAFRLFEEGARLSPPPSQKKTSDQEIDRLAYQKRMADVLLAQGKKDEARQLVDVILKDAPKDEDARRIRASLLLEAGGAENVTTVLAELKALMEANDKQRNDPRLRSLLGRAYMLAGDLDAARREFQQVANWRKDDVQSRYALAGISLNQSKTDEAIRYADEILALDSTNGPVRLLKVIAMTNAGYYGRARSELMNLQRDFPKSREVQLQVGFLALAEKKYAEAERVFRKLNEAGTGDVSPVAGLVSAYGAQNQWDRAIDLLNADLKKSPGSAAIHQLMATTAARAGKYDLAVTEYQNLLAKNPKSVELRIQLGEVYQLKGDLGNAIAALQAARELAPKDSKPIMLLASYLQRAGRYKEAQAEYQHVLELLPDNPFVLNNIAFLLVESGGDLDEALRVAQRALGKSPGHPVLTDTLGWIYLKKGNKDSAVQTFSNLVRQEPKNPTYRYHYAMALLEKGDREAARKEAQSALTSQPDPDTEQKIKALASRIG
jgi:tetratricopeptide (TPR) repeat protein